MTDIPLDIDLDDPRGGDIASLFDHPGAPDYGHEALVVREAQARLRDFTARAAGGVVFTSADLFHEFCTDLMRLAEDGARKKPKGKEPEVWAASDQLSAVKYAREQGFVTPLEAQRLVRKLLRLKGMRSLAVAPPRVRRATPSTRRRTAR